MDAVPLPCNVSGRKFGQPNGSIVAHDRAIAIANEVVNIDDFIAFVRTHYDDTTAASSTDIAEGAQAPPDPPIENFY